ncbi:histidine phosphatase family protein [Mycolicibacterium smegmatis]|uniref:histidine phosphatase family protein n=1 Tax=Mycolicibacterium smegmatis TaxID=1772 RepID=UPI001E456488|nr:histidine phosphatase family protein [Mycolicibacterium smegmatis]
MVFLVRHGQARAHAYGAAARNRSQGGLTELGRKQADLTGQALAGRIDAITAAVSGDLARQEETLEHVLTAAAHEGTPISDPHWNEYDMDAILGGGLATGPAGRELQSSVDAALQNWVAPAEDTATPAIETYEQYRQRCARALDAVRDLAGRGQTVVAVSSSGTITQIVAQIWGLSESSWITLSRTMINASITKLIVGSTGISVVSVNEHSHLDAVDENGARPLMTFR